MGQLLRCDDVAAESGVVDKAASWGVGGGLDGGMVGGGGFTCSARAATAEGAGARRPSDDEWEV